MKALILAAGRGSRMGNLTTHAPKCLLPLAGKPLLQWQMEAIQQAGIHSLAIVKGYLSSCLDPFDLVQFENPRWQESNMVRSLLCAKSWLADDCIISYGDIVFPKETIQRLKDAPGDIVISFNTEWKPLWESRFADPLADLETFSLDSSGNLAGIGARASRYEDIEGQYMGLLKFSRAGWIRIENYLARQSDLVIDKMSMTDLLQRLLSEKITVATVPISGKWYEVDSEQDFRLYENWVSNGNSWLR